MQAQSDPYADPSIYDILHTPGSQAEADVLLRIYRALRVRAPRRLSVLEPACGTGRLLRIFERRGARVHGFDTSQAMLDYARKRMRRPHLFRANMEDFDAEISAGSIDLAFNTINSIRHLESDAALQRHLAAMACALSPRGLYLVGLGLCRYGVDEPTEDQWRARRGRLSAWQLVQYLPPASARAVDRFEQVFAHLRIERPSGSESRDSHYRLRAYDRRQWELQIERSPLSCAGLFDDRGNQLALPDADYTLYALASS